MKEYSNKKTYVDHFPSTVCNFGFSRRLGAPDSAAGEVVEVGGGKGGEVGGWSPTRVRVQLRSS